MSITLMAKVFRRTFGSATRKAVAVKLADHADDYGCGIWPSAESLAAECEVSIPTVRRTLKHFVEESGLLILMKKGGSGRFSTNRYDMDLAVLEKTPLHDVAKAKQDAQNSASSTGSKVITVTTLEGGLGDHCDSLGDHGDSLGDHRDSQTISKPSDNLSCAEALEKEVSDSGFDKKAIERQFKAFGPTWPTWVHDSEPAARKAWFDLTDIQRDAAVARMDDYLVASKTGGRTNTCALARYLREQCWEKLGTVEVKAVGPHQLNIYGSGWMAYRLALLAGGRSQWKPTAMMQKMMQTGNAALFDDDRRRGEFPLVTRMDKEAENGRGVPLPKDVSALDTTGFVKMKVGSDLWQQWADWHENMDYPWIDPPRHIEWMWVPEAVPEIAGVSDDEDQDYIEASL